MRFSREFSSPVGSGEIQVKPTLRFPLTPVRMAKIKKTAENQRWKGWRWNHKWMQTAVHCGEQLQQERP